MSSTTANPLMPVQAQAAATANSARSVLTMPLLGTKSSPELFQGDCSRVRTFLDHYERLCAFHNVTLDHDMVTSILPYCNTRVREIIEGMPHFHTPHDTEEVATVLALLSMNPGDQHCQCLHTANSWFLKRIGINVQSDPHSGTSLNEFLAIDADVCILQIHGKLRNWADERQGPLSPRESACS
ncbi:hypothetical protein EDD15DRAFT_2372403 [Pisolithus albus]|nr:hypothetical protein EDD15DRAFT_2372403 [Pisolithus albus]